MMHINKYLLGMLLGTMVLAMSCTQATFIEPNQMFTNNMVLQQQTTVKIWGKADANVKITVKGSWGVEATCKTDTKGNWLAELPTIIAGGPYELSILSGAIVKTYTNVMLGEVWVCSGQSNMEMPLAGNWAHVNNANQEAAAANYPNIRLFTVQKNIAFNPIDTITTQGWLPCDSNTVKEFSATAYFFGRKLNQDLNVPIGLIHTSWGGTVAEAWTSKASLLALPDFAERAEQISALNASYDSLERKFEADTKQMQDEILTADPGFDADKAVYAYSDLDDSDWFPMDLPRMWEDTELGNYDGSTWYRKTITVSAAMAKQKLSLCYGAPDDWDEAWVNGVKVGENKVWGQLREYPIPDGLIKSGKNLITLRVYDYKGGGGFMGETKDYFLLAENGQKIPLAKGWLTKKGFDFKDIHTHPVSAMNPNQPTVLYNAMIHPLLPYTIKGAIWYQGESNSGRAYQYRELFKTMITDWRKVWGVGNFPFYFVQLANYMARNETPVDDTWAELREAQTIALELPNTGMAVTIDIGNPLDIHPGNKQDVGGRLALNALAKTYGHEIPYMGPLYKSFEVIDKTIELSFDFVYQGLAVANGNELIGFAIAGADKEFHWANATIKGDKIRVSSPKVDKPVAVRYAWSSNPACNLVNTAGLPASPFRTDNWKLITQP
jgi:sialate O-acetylesterase